MSAFSQAFLSQKSADPLQPANTDFDTPHAQSSHHQDVADEVSLLPSSSPHR
ncbi:Uncharacterised protein [Vibrio cholerae]|nr:Uncharacterised protein [Vibrio cholerae]CSI21488.1 Uncharacterised protein [Vibrio cholerae]